MRETKPEQGVPQDKKRRGEMARAVAEYAAEHHLVPPLSMEELRDHASRVTSQSSLLDYAMVLLNNEVWRDTVASIPYNRRLLLLPQCLRNHAACPAQIDEFGLLCEECGRCEIGALQALAEDQGYVVLVAEGSTVVSKLLAGGKVDAVVGVSCLNALEKSFPHMADGAIPGLAIPLTLDGCVNTDTDFDRVRAAIELKSSRPWKNQVDTREVQRVVEEWFAAPFACATESERVAYDWLLADGKRWRPYLLACVYSALREGATDFPDDVRKLAIAVECFHKASLVHDDIEDNDAERYGRPTLHKEYGVPVAINAGDLLVGEGYRWIAAVERDVPELLRIAAGNHRALCVGQGEELAGVGRDQPFAVEQVLEIARRKTAPAFGVSLLLGAVAAGADRDLLDALQAFSESLGIAYQIRDDLEEYKSGEATDLRASIILALALEAAPQFMAGGARAARPGGGPPSLHQLRHQLDELMVAEKAAQLLEHYKNEAVRALNPLRNALLKTLLRRVATKMLEGV